MHNTEADYAFEAFDHNFGLSGGGKTLLAGLDLSARDYDAKEAVHHAGDEVNSVYIVLSGWLTTVINRADGQRLLLDFHVPVDLTGLEFLSQTRAQSSLVAFERSRVVRVPADAFAEALTHNDEIAVAVLRTLAAGYISLQHQMATFAFADAPAKMARLILGLRDKQTRNKFDDPDVLRLPLTQYDIADALGLSNVTVSRTFTRWGEAGLVDFKRKRITIHDADGLREHVGLS